MKQWQQLLEEPARFQRFWVREQVIDAIRAFFKRRGFHEVETPLLVRHPGTEPYLEVFETSLHLQHQPPTRGFLTTSPELSMKKLLTAGSGNIFQLCKSFRNAEGISDWHNPEFTILEWYRVAADYTDIMQDCEELLRYILTHVRPGEQYLEYQGLRYDLAGPWQRLSVAEAFEQVGVTVDELLSSQALPAKAAAKGYQADGWEAAFNAIFLNEIEPQLGQDQPTILYDYPVAQAALSRRKPSDPRFAERFECYLAGLELGNAFTELVDAQEQRQRMEADLRERAQAGKIRYDLDQDFIQALELGLPESGGIAMGVDRLVMLFADVPRIQDVLFFPVEDVFEVRV